MECIRLKDSVPFQKLIELGFVEDPVNCEEGDHYYLNNYYFSVTEEFRITVNLLSRHIDVLCLPKDTGLHNMFNLKPLHDLLINGLVEVVED